MRATPAGDAALLVEADGPASGLAAAIAAQGWPGVLDVIPGARTVLVTVRPGSCVSSPTVPAAATRGLQARARC